MTEPVHPVRIMRITYEAIDILSFEFARLDASALWPFDAGSHVDVELPNGLMRSYSLSNPSADHDRYRLTVARDAKSKGGSTTMHDTLRVGQILKIGEPRNNFPLFEGASLSVFIAGGIGVTPFLPMMVRLNNLGKPWRIHYCVRTRDRAALLPEIEVLAAAGQGEVVTNYDEEPGGAMVDLGALIGALGSDDHVYCCGPIGMLDGFRAACDANRVSEERVHFEYFSSNVEAAAGGYEVVLAKSGRSIRVGEDETLLDALTAAGLDIPFSCQEGVCGACETKVLDGVPDHRDMILSAREKAANKTMMVCCSGSKSPVLTLDL